MRCTPVAACRCAARGSAARRPRPADLDAGPGFARELVEPQRPAPGQGVSGRQDHLGRLAQQRHPLPALGGVGGRVARRGGRRRCRTPQPARVRRRAACRRRGTAGRPRGRGRAAPARLPAASVRPRARSPSGPDRGGRCAGARPRRRPGRARRARPQPRRRGPVRRRWAATAPGRLGQRHADLVGQRLELLRYRRRCEGRRRRRRCRGRQLAQRGRRDHPRPPARRLRRSAPGRQLPRHPRRPRTLPAAVARRPAVRGDRLPDRVPGAAAAGPGALAGRVRAGVRHRPVRVPVRRDGRRDTDGPGVAGAADLALGGGIGGAAGAGRARRGRGDRRRGPAGHTTIGRP